MDIKLLPKILSIRDGKDVLPFVGNILEKVYGNCSTDGDNYMLFINDKSTSLLQAHIDTVKRDEKFELLMRNEVIFSNGVLGADDRAGVWAILKLVKICTERKVQLPSVLFTNYEETGGGGMKEFVKKKISEFKHLHLAIAMDRRGCGHYVTYNHLAKEVKNYMAHFGWDDQTGSFSDISLFTDEYLVPSVNVSVGYHSEHTKYETLNLDELYLTINRVYKMLKFPIKQLYPSQKKYVYSWPKYNYEDYKKDHKVKDFSSARYPSTCDFCGAVGMVNYVTSLKQRLCDSCYDDWCLTLTGQTLI